MPHIILLAVLVPQAQEVTCTVVSTTHAPHSIMTTIWKIIGECADLPFAWGAGSGSPSWMSLTVARAAFVEATKAMAANAEIRDALANGTVLIIHGQHAIHSHRQQLRARSPASTK